MNADVFITVALPFLALGVPACLLMTSSVRETLSPGPTIVDTRSQEVRAFALPGSAVHDSDSLLSQRMNDGCTVVDSTTVESIAYAEAVRAMDAQSATLESLRTRAATILSAAALVTAFLGGQALAVPGIEKGVIQRQPLNDTSWAAIAAFAAVVVLCLAVLFPYRWRSQMSATALMQGAAKAKAGASDVQRDLARYLDANRAQNQTLLARLFVCLGLAGIFLLVEAVAWILELT